MMHKKTITTKIALFLVFFSGISTLSALKAQDNSQSAEKQGRLFKYYFYEALRTKSIGQYGAAFDYFNFCQQLDSTNANVNYELGNFYNSFQDPNKTLAYYRQAVKYDPTNFYYNMGLATSYLDQKKYADAIPIYESMIHKSPEKHDLYLYLAEAYRLNKDLKNAVGTLNKLEDLIGMNEKISLQKFQLYSELNEKDKAYAEVQKYIDKYPNSARYLILMGNLYAQDNREKEALKLFNRAKAIDPQNAYLITSMAEYYQQIGDKESAKKELHAALFNSRADIDTKIEILGEYIGMLQKNNKETTNANALLDTLITQYPQEPRLNLMYGDLLLSQNRNDSAQFQFQTYTEAKPIDPVGWEQLLRTTFPDSIQASMDICKKAMHYLPNEPLFYFYLGNAQYIKEDYKSALATFKDGVPLADQKPYLQSQFYGLIGDIHQQMGQSDSAFAAYDKALVAYPQNIPVMNNYSYYLSLKKKDLNKAEKMSSFTVKVEPTNPTYLDTYGWVLFQEKAYISAKIYIENAINYSLNPPGTTLPDSAATRTPREISAEMLEHYGDVLYKTNDKDKALEYWIKAKEQAEKTKKGNTSKLLEKKIEAKTYFSE